MKEKNDSEKLLDLKKKVVDFEKELEKVISSLKRNNLKQKK